jgi:hypothetical protein
MEETTTEAVADTGVQETQPEVTETPAEAVTETTEQVQEETPQEPSEDDTSEWLKAKGIDPSDPDAIKKLAKSAREAEKAMHKKAQRASELEKSLQSTSDEVAEDVAVQTGQDPELLKRVQRVEVRDAVRDFWDSHPDARDIEQEMVKELQTRPHLAGDLEALYLVVKSKNLDSIKSQAKQETLQNLAQKQQASVPTGNATSSTVSSNKITSQNVNEMVSKMSLDEYRRRLPEINRALAGN